MYIDKCVHCILTATTDVTFAHVKGEMQKIGKINLKRSSALKSNMGKQILSSRTAGPLPLPPPVKNWVLKSTASSYAVAQRKTDNLASTQHNYKENEIRYGVAFILAI